MKLRHPISYVSLIVALVVAGCGGSDSSSTTSDSAFPTQLMLVSPMASGEGSSSPSSLLRMRSFASSAPGTGLLEPADVEIRAAVAKDISGIMASPSKLATLFSAKRFFERGAGNAPCYGPTLNYVNHPDGAASNTGQLPSGDLGIWKETVSDTDTTACAAAQLNRNVYAASHRVNMGIRVLAAMRAVSRASSGSPIAAGSSKDLAGAMSALGLSDVVFNTALLERDSTGNTWMYTLDISYTDPSTGRTSIIQLTLRHTSTPSAPLPSNGLLTYRITDTVNAGNCPTTGSAGARDVVRMGTLAYSQSATTAMQVSHRTGQFCGGLTNLPENVTGSDGQLNPAANYDATTGKGWADDFNRFAGQYNPVGGAGKYVYAWQAGHMDSHTRILGVNINTDNTTGEAYFGFGDDISTTDGWIKGMICNWAGPGNSHTPLPYVQRQALKWNSTLEKWEVYGAGGSDIRYAPTTTCKYTTVQQLGGATFWYDRDLTGATSGLATQPDLIVEGSESVSLYPFDLKDTSIEAMSYATVKEMMEARGYTHPGNF